MKKILITGSAGLIGSHLSRYLLSQGHSVVGIDNLFGGYEEFLPTHENFTFYKCDVEDVSAVSEVFSKHNFDVVYHLAAYAAEGLSPFIRRFNYQNNIIGSINIINQCIEKDIKIIFTSSMAVYGCSVPPFTEDQTPNPCDPYGIAKYAVEQDLKQAFSQFGLRYSILRPHNVIGTHQNIWDNYRNAIGIFIRKCLNNEDITVYGDGEQTRAFSDISFYMEPFSRLISEYDDEVFNIGASKVYTLNEAASIVKEVATEKGYHSNIIHTEGRHEVKHAFSDHSKASQLLDFNDETNLKEVVCEMFSWAEKQTPREIKKMDYEITKGMYSYWR